MTAPTEQELLGSAFAMLAELLTDDDMKIRERSADGPDGGHEAIWDIETPGFRCTLLMEAYRHFTPRDVDRVLGAGGYFSTYSEPSVSTATPSSWSVPKRSTCRRAIYLQAGEADLDVSVAPFTADADLSIDPAKLGSDPRITEAMTGAGFTLKVKVGGGIEPGTWLGTITIDGQAISVPVDLLVPETLAPFIETERK